MPHRRSRAPCDAGTHRYRGHDHHGGCFLEPTPHYCVRCRVCIWRWCELALFDARAFEVVA